MFSKGEKGSEIIRKGSAAVLFYPWKHPSGHDYWRWMWHDPETGKRKYGTRASEKLARKLATDRARELSGGFLDLNALPDPVKRAISRMVTADPSMSMVDEFLAWKARERPQKVVGEAVAQFLESTKANRGLSIQNYRTLRSHLLPFAAAFPSRMLTDITTPEISQYLLNKDWKNRTRRNNRASIVTFFRWAQSHGYVAEGKTAPEGTVSPKVARKTPETWSAEEMALMLSAVTPGFLPWLACTAFGGFRTDEIYPLSKDKIPLDWGDFKWDRGIIIVKDETSKTNRRIVPILPALKDWLWPIRKKSGAVGSTSCSPTQKRIKTEISETAKLGALVGGWRANAIRHTWISCRAAVTSIGQAAMEAGNSEAEAKRSYVDAIGPDEAEEWFKLTRENVAERLRNISKKSS